MKVAITGGTGFLGKNVISLLKEKEIDIKVLSRNIEIKDFCYKTNYSKEDLINSLKDITAVIHLAASRGSQGEIKEFHNNEVLTQNLYDACVELNIKNVVYASTISVYSSAEELPWKEKNIPRPSSMYGISKVVCEQIGNLYSEKKGLKVKNLRLAHLYGFNEKNNYMINKFFRQAYNEQELVLDSKSEAKREFLYVKDAANAVYKALMTYEYTGTLNIGTQDQLTNIEVAKNINEVFNNNGNLTITNPNKIENIQSSYMDSSEAEKKIGFIPTYKFNEALKDIYILMEELENVPIFY